MNKSNIMSYAYLIKRLSRVVLKSVLAVLVISGFAVAEDLKIGTSQYIQVAPYTSRAELANAKPGVEKGKQLFNYWCIACHGAGPGHPGTAALKIKHGNHLPGELENRADLHPEFIRHTVRTGISNMPFFRKVEISDSELESLALYLSQPK